MFENEIAINKFLRGYLQNVLMDLSEADLNTVVAENVSPPLRIVAHLAIAADFGLKRLGQPMTCPPDWAAAYGPGTVATSLPANPPSKIQVLRQVEVSYDALCAAAAKADPEYLKQPNEVPWFASTPILTNGHAVALMLTGHFAVHLGQISMTRRLRGLPPLF